MGQAKRRGTFEQRKQAALDAAAEVVRRAEAVKRMRATEIARGYEHMTDEQFVLSAAREERIRRNEYEARMLLAHYAALAAAF